MRGGLQEAGRGGAQQARQAAGARRVQVSRGHENMRVTCCNSCSLREHLFYAGIFLSMTFIVILCLVLVNNNNNNSNNPSLSTADHQSGAQLAISATGEENIFKNIKILRKYIIIICTFSGSWCPPLLSPHNGHVHITGNLTGVVTTDNCDKVSSRAFQRQYLVRYFVIFRCITGWQNNLR